MSNSKISVKRKLDALANEFEEQWLPGQRAEIWPFLEQVEEPHRDQLLQMLLEVDVELRTTAGQEVSADDYAGLGEQAVAHVSNLLAADAESTIPPNSDPFKTRDARSTDKAGENDDALAALPEKIGRYRIQGILGEGGFGIVYLAYDDQLDRQVAIKVPHARLIKKPSDAKYYLAEARIVASLDHPYIVPVHDVGSTEVYPCYIVSKYVEGTDLSIRLKQQPIVLTQAVELLASVAEALHYAHKRGVFHRDVKPSNILLDTDGKPYVVDFGLALREEDIDTGPGYAGTPVYMSPEQARGEGHRVDGRSDIFSLGVVLYEMLVGRRPFRAKKQRELLNKIATMEARPPRQIDDTVPKELERICLKAISKRASDRYTTALDFGDDLRNFLEELPAGAETESFVTGLRPPTGSDSTKVGPDSETPKLDSDSQQIRIVPKGLRSFDAHDADFFLELLPGPRDRHGLPDSLRFWKTRIEETDADDTFSIGLIYGPSGCGKSSLVKAGLLPRLNEDVISVYVEATPDDTEPRLLHGLRKQCPGIEVNLSLKETMAALRRGQGIAAGKRVLIVLDQFEQWLHTKGNEGNTELVQALRQCDGGRVQCILMVRDDFWMAVTRCLSELEVELTQGKNFAPVDLFPVRHAKKVLAAFGRAFGAIPDDNIDISKEQNEFLKHSVAGLAEDDKVICVRLALFAEMMKTKPWTEASLKEVGGTQGVGVTFLKETFSTHANPKHRLHQEAVRAVLKALLPESGTDIKGEMKSYDELLEASGYANHDKSFDELVRILDNEIRLITPTDPEESDKESNPDSQIEIGQKYYQLSHDYLVPSLREWLTSKQKETRRGRAELRLAERFALWSSKQENRFLPSWWESLNVRLFTDRKKWTGPQRKMMRRAFWTHVRQLMIGTVTVLLLAFLIYSLSTPSENPISIFSDPIKKIASRKSAFDELDLENPDILKAIAKTFRDEKDSLELHELIHNALDRLEQNPQKLIRSTSENSDEQDGFLRLITGIVERTPNSNSDRESIQQLDQVRERAFKILSNPDLSLRSADIIEIIQKEFRDDADAKDTNDVMRNYVRGLDPQPVTKELADLYSNQLDPKLRIASLQAWGTFPDDALLEGIESLHSESRKAYLLRLIDSVETDEVAVGKATVEFLNRIPPDSLLDYFWKVVPGEPKNKVSDCLLAYAEQTDQQRRIDIGREIEDRLASLLEPDGGKAYKWEAELEFLIMAIGELATIGDQRRIKPFQDIENILIERATAEGDYLLDSVIVSFANLQRRQVSQNPASISTIRQILVDSETDSNNRIAAAKSLGILLDKKSLPMLLKIVENRGNDEELRVVALNSVKLLISEDGTEKPSVVPIVRIILSEYNEPEDLRLEALDFCGELATAAEVELILPQMLADSNIPVEAMFTLHQIMINAGEDAGLVADRILPFLSSEYTENGLNMFPATIVLVPNEFPQVTPAPAELKLQSAKSVAVALAKAAADDSNADSVRVLAARSLSNRLGSFRPKNPVIIDPDAESSRKQQLNDWLKWWREHEGELELISN